MAAYATDAPKFRLLESVVLDRPSCKLLVIDGMEDSIFPIEDNFIVGVKGDKKIWLSEVTGLTWAIPGRRSSCTDGSMTRWRGNLEVIEQGSTDFAEEIARKIFDEWRNGRLTELRFCVIAVSTSIQLLIVEVWPSNPPSPVSTALAVDEALLKSSRSFSRCFGLSSLRKDREPRSEGAQNVV